MSVWERRGKTPERQREKMIASTPPPHTHSQTHSLEKSVREKKGGGGRSYILISVPVCLPHVSQNAFPFTAESRMGKHKCNGSVLFSECVCGCVREGVFHGGSTSRAFSIQTENTPTHTHTHSGNRIFYHLQHLCMRFSSAAAERRCSRNEFSSPPAEEPRRRRRQDLTRVCSRYPEVE